jgi:branched-chain amino acid transport system permease protein
MSQKNRNGVAWLSQPLKFGRPPDSSAKKRRNMRTFLLVLILAALFPLAAMLVLPIFGPTVYGDIQSAVDQTLVYVLLALGLNVVVGYAGLLDLGYAAFFAIGAYTMGFLTSKIFHFGFWVALPVSFLVAGLFGVLLGAPTLGLRGDYLAIVTLGFGEIVPNVFKNLNQLTGGDTGLGGIDSPFAVPASRTPADALLLGRNALADWYYLTLGIIVLSTFVILRLVDSRVGRAWIAIREDEIAASAMGIDPVRTKLLAFGVGASFAGFAGAIFASTFGTANPTQFQFAVSILILSMIILGGMGNIWGVIFGAIALEFSNVSFVPFIAETVNKIGRENNNEFLQNLAGGSRFLIFGLILVIMMLVRPEGLFPSGRRKMELKPEDNTA